MRNEAERRVPKPSNLSVCMPMAASEDDNPEILVVRWLSRNVGWSCFHV